MNQMPRNVFTAMFGATLFEAKGHLRYLELGVFIGETMDTVARCVPTSTRFGVDIKVVYAGGTGTTMYEMTSQDYLEGYAAEDGPFDLAFIDADHKFESVRDDFTALWPFMSDQSLILLDDTWPPTPADAVPGLCNDAWKMAHWLRFNGYEAVTIPCDPGLTIVRKATTHLLWVPDETE